MADLIEIDINVRSNAGRAVLGLDKLEGTIVKQLRTVERLERGYKRLDSAFNKGKISAQTYAEGMRQVDASIEEVWNSSTRATNALQAQNAAMAASTRGVNRYGVLTQQAGYQIGDFIVQVQGGTNAFVAFGQQATQVAGTLTLLGGKWVIIGSVLGVLIPLTTALGAAISRTTNGASQLNAEFDKLEGILRPVAPLIDSIISAFVGMRELAFDALNLVVNNLDRLVVFATAAATFFAGRFVAAFVAAKVATLSFATSLTFLRAALIRTGIGALVVGAGELLYQMTRLSSAAGGFGEALTLLGRIAKGVFDGIVAAGKAIPTALSSYFQLIKADWNIMLSDLLYEFSVFLQDLANQAPDFGPFVGFSNALTNAATSVTRASGNFAAAAGEAYAESERLAESAKTAVTEGFADASAAMEDLRVTLANSEREDFDIRNILGLGKGEDPEKSLSKVDKAAEELRKTLEGPLVSAIGSVSDAWADFIMRGFSDFKSFTQAILNSFKSMIAQMISIAVRNRIMLSLGVGGITPSMAAAGQVAGLGSAGFGALGSLGTGAGLSGIAGGTGLLGGAGNAIAGLGGGGAGFFNVGANAAAAGGGTLATIGAVAAPLLAVAAVFSFFRKRTKELDSGLQVTVKNMDSFVESFQTIQTKRFWGLSKRTSTNTTAMSSDNPISQSIFEIQNSIFQTAEYLGIATDALNTFSYDFRVSLQGLTEEQKTQKITEELTKMGNAFAALLPNIQSMEQLTSVLNERVSLEIRLLRVQGDTQALRERELASVHQYNRGILEQIFAAEDAAAATAQLNAALNSLSENNFATLLDFRRAQAATRMGMPVANTPAGIPTPPVVNSSASVSSSNSSSGEVAQLRADMKEMHKEVMFAYSKLIKNSKDSRDTLRSWDAIGIPPERT